MGILLAVLFICAFMARIVEFFTVLGCKDELLASAPDYARNLYRPVWALPFRRDPIHLSVLFRGEPPAQARATVSLMRWVCDVSLGLMLGAVAVVGAMFLTALWG